MAWTSNNSNNWNNSSLKSYLNNDYYNLINETYKNMISEETYYLGGPTIVTFPAPTASKFYDIERSNNIYGVNPTNIKQHIGLIYPSDYGYAAGSSCLSTALQIYNKGCYTNDYLYNGMNYWLQIPRADESKYVTHINTSGNVSYAGRINTDYAVRPSLYLLPEVKITEGNGTKSDPYQIKLS